MEIMEIVILFYLVMVCLSIGAVIFWICMLVNCLSRKDFPDKIVWVLVILFLNLLGAFLYFAIAKGAKPKTKSVGPVPWEGRWNKNKIRDISEVVKKSDLDLDI